MSVYNFATQVGQANALKTLLTGGKLHLFNAAIPDDPNIALATLVAAECTFGGYAAIVVPTMLGPYNAPGGGQTVTIPGVQWDFTVSPSDTAFGYFITDSASAILYAMGSFPTPIPLAAVGDAVSLVLLFTVMNDGLIEIVANGVEG